MAGLAADALLHVNAVIEVDVIGKIVNLGPADRFVGLEAVTDRLERGAVDPDLRVAVHAGLGWRDHGMLRVLNAGVAVAAIDAHGARVVRMAEGNGLLARFALARRIGGIGNQFVERSA